MGPDRKKALPPENGRVIAAETLPRKPSSIDEGGGKAMVHMHHGMGSTPLTSVLPHN